MSGVGLVSSAKILHITGNSDAPKGENNLKQQDRRSLVVKPNTLTHFEAEYNPNPERKTER